MVPTINLPASCRPGDYPDPRNPWRGQGLVELALLAPLVLFAASAAIDGGRLFIQKADQDRRTAVIADWAAAHPGDSSWNSVANGQLPDCTVTVEETRPGLWTAGASCFFSPLMLHGIWDGLPVASQASSVTPQTSEEPSPAPSGTTAP